MERRLYRGMASATSAFLLLSIGASLNTANGEEPSYLTGCLRQQGLMLKLAVGDAPLRPCATGEVELRLALAGAVPPRASVKRVFLTSQVFSGNLGGIAGADAKCQAAAKAAGLGGRWRAWVSSDTSSPASDPNFTKHDGPYVRLDGVPIASNWADLVDTTILAPIAQDEYGNYPRAVTEAYALEPYAFTGTDRHGNATIRMNCNNWTSDGTGNPALKGVVGVYAKERPNEPSPTEGTWSDLFTYGHPCSDRLRLYCFEQ